MSVTAKFKVGEIAFIEGGSRIKLYPVIGGSKENDSFFKWTPYGEIVIGTVNPDATRQFEVGKEYYVSFSESKEEEVVNE